MMLSALDNPEGAAARKGKKLRRRVYHSKVRLLGYCTLYYLFSGVLKGPDYIWHVDGYDKLKPYGFAIHACIDG